MMLWLDMLLRFYVVIEPVIFGRLKKPTLLFLLFILNNVNVTDVNVTRPDVVGPFFL